MGAFLQFACCVFMLFASRVGLFSQTVRWQSNREDASSLLQREFQHPMFKRGHKHLLKHIKRNRRPAGQGIHGGRSTNSDSVETVLEEFPTVKLQLAEMERNYDVLCATLHELWSHTRALKDEHDALKGNVGSFKGQQRLNV